MVWMCVRQTTTNGDAICEVMKTSVCALHRQHAEVVESARRDVIQVA